MAKLNNNKGFTIIECMIAFTFIAVSMMVAQYTVATIFKSNANNFNTRQEFETFVNTFIQDTNNVTTDAQIRAIANGTIATKNVTFSSSYDKLDTNYPTNLTDNIYFYYNSGTPAVTNASGVTITTYTRKYSQVPLYYFVVQ